MKRLINLILLAATAIMLFSAVEIFADSEAYALVVSGSDALAVENGEQHFVGNYLVKNKYFSDNHITFFNYDYKSERTTGK